MTSGPYEPQPEDRFTFGLWTVGNVGRDPFGVEVREALDPVDIVHHLADIGAYGVTLHDNDLVPADASAAEREVLLKRFREALDSTGLKVPMTTVNLFTRPVFKEGALTANDPDVRRFALAKALDAIDLGAELGADIFVLWGGREGTEAHAAKPVAEALDRYAEAINAMTAYIGERGYKTRIAIEPKPNEPRGDILLPTVGHALAFINGLADPDMVGVNPEIGHEEMAGLNYAHGIAQALWHGKLFHIDLNGQHGPRFDQDLRFGAGNVRGAFWVVDTVESGGYDGPLHFDYKPPRTEDDEGVWVTAAACMRNYLILREKVRAFRSDPEVIEALRASGVDQLRTPTLADGETWRDVREASADVDTLARRGLAYEHLDQLALEHLYGVRP